MANEVSQDEASRWKLTHKSHRSKEQERGGGLDAIIEEIDTKAQLSGSPASLVINMQVVSDSHTPALINKPPTPSTFEVSYFFSSPGPPAPLSSPSTPFFVQYIHKKFVTP